MKTHHLQIEYDYSFDLYGLVTSVKDYKLAWALNRLLNLHLTRQKDLCYELLGRDRLLIANYRHVAEHSEVRLFRNRALGSPTLKKAFLLPDVKEYDYVLQITGAMQQLHPQELARKLMRTPLVQYVKQFDPLTLKFKENLIF
ncbi:IPExxxVDY family protein [Pontibacter litorisediminis]|uniref:IPExxxVDY family protein n=1 Tax=Pontibacter litorisediminis TaxID=1846260 RepID=UPI0023EB95A1|nr:IPExxxVDY family protein [Pontibacter litorisediminis]